MNRLERHDIQGMLLSAYGHLPWSANVLLRIDDAARARLWLATLATEITPATGKLDKHSTNLAFTYAGLVRLGLRAPAEAFPLAYVDGMATDRRATILGDIGPSGRAHWYWGQDADDVHLLLLLFAHQEVALHIALDAHRAVLATAGLHEVGTLLGQRHPDGKEHFGFADGIAQPAIAGEDRSEPARRRTNAANDVAAGEFILGYPNEYGYPAETVAVEAGSDPTQILPENAPGQRDFGRNGSYLVLRQLEQDVAGFWNFLDATTRGPAGGDPRRREWLAAKLVGRWPNGAPLVKAPDAPDSHLANENTFGFAADRRGLRCPVGAHIRRANPRDGFAGDTAAQSLRRSNRHRLLRRGRPYGPRIENVLDDDGRRRGLIFICLGSDIERQFEFVQQTWLNNPTFCGLANEIDPLVGTPRPNAHFTIPNDPLRIRVKNLTNFVTTRGGAYFFLPGLRAIRFLAALDAAPSNSSAVQTPSLVAGGADDRWTIDAQLGEALQPGERELAERIAAHVARGVCEQFSVGRPARRDVHVRAHGCVAADFQIASWLPRDLAQGVFIPGRRYAAWIRFSNGIADPGGSDTRGDVHAMAIKLLGVDGPSHATQDFLLLDSPVFAAFDAAGYLRFIERQASPNPIARSLAPFALGLRGLAIGRRMQASRIGNPLAVRYWSTVPFRLGDPPYKSAVKYSAIPRTPGLPTAPRGAARGLRAAMIATLRTTDVTFDFALQRRTSDALSIEDPRSEWSERDAPFTTVATLTIPRQEFATDARDELAENLAFNPWHALAQHRPLGGINRTRRIVYETVADLRRRFNGVATEEPAAPGDVR